VSSLMGNYLLSLRAPPPAEDERQHPLYYDWTVPKWSPFLDPPKTPCEAAKESAETCAPRVKDDVKNVASTAGKVAKSAIKEAQDDIKKATSSTTKSVGVTGTDKSSNKETRSMVHQKSTKSAGNSAGKMQPLAKKETKPTNSNEQSAVKANTSSRQVQSTKKAS